MGSYGSRLAFHGSRLGGYVLLGGWFDYTGEVERESNVRGGVLGATEVRAASSRALLGVGVGAWRVAGLALLLFAVSVNKFTVEVGGLTVKLEHIVTIGLMVVMAAMLARDVVRHGLRVTIVARATTTTTTTTETRETKVAMRWVLGWPLLWIVPYVGVLLVSALVNSPDRGDSLRQTAMVGLVAASAWVVWWLVDTRHLLRLAVWMLIGLGLLEAVYTLVTLGAANFGSTVGTQPGNGYIIVPYGTLWEPNLLGSYLAAAGVLLVSMLFGGSGKDPLRRQRWLAGGLGLILVTLGLSLARASWVGFFVGASVVLLLYRMREKKQERVRGQKPLGLGTALGVEWRRALSLSATALAGAVAALVLVAPLLFPTTARGILVRVNPNWYDPARDPSVQLRVGTMQAALEGIGQHPFLGTGAGSYGLTHEDDRGGRGWISNLELHILYDSGAVGLLLFLGGLGWVMWRALGVVLEPAREGEDDEGEDDKGDVRPYVIGLVGALATLLFAFQATEGTWMAYFWVYVGLVAACAGRRATAGGQLL